MPSPSSTRFTHDLKASSIPPEAFLFSYFPIPRHSLSRSPYGRLSQLQTVDLPIDGLTFPAFVIILSVSLRTCVADARKGRGYDSKGDPRCPSEWRVSPRLLTIRSYQC